MSVISQIKWKLASTEKKLATLKKAWTYYWGGMRDPQWL